MQDDDASNPGFLWVQQGEALWRADCGGCHDSMRGVAARYPVYDAKVGRPVTLAQRITEHQPTAPRDTESLLALTAYLGWQSRGAPMHVEIDGPARPFFEAGKALFSTRMGQLNLSCAQCHDGLAGQRLAGSVIPQGHPNGYPEYRLEWQSLGSLERRIRNCMVGVRAEPFADDALELVELELYLGWRANGLTVETPAVRP